MKPIAIIGMACKFPGQCNDLETYWEFLREGKSALSEIPPERFDINEYYDPERPKSGKIYTRKGCFVDKIDQFDAAFFGISPREAEMMDPQQRLLLEVSWHALENANEASDELKESDTATIVGIIYREYASLLYKAGGLDVINPHFSTGNSNNSAVGRISYHLGLQGPTFAVDSACSSSLVAIHTACQNLELEQCNLALAGGISLILEPELFIELSQVGALAPDGRCKTFDASGDGFGRGEGCGMVVLKRLDDAIRDNNRILGVIRGSACNEDGASANLSAPNVFAQEKLIRKALKNAGLSSTDINYVEAHGTGTSLGDPIEVRAITAAYGENRTDDNPLYLGSAKANVNHMEATAGVGGVIKLVLSLMHEQIPPHVGMEKLNPLIELPKIPAIIPEKLIPWPKTTATPIGGVSSFGFSGINAHLIIEQGPGEKGPSASQDDRPIHILALSAKNKEALKVLADKYIHFLEQHPEYSFPDICYSALVGRSHFEHRLAVIAKDHQEAIQKLRSFENSSECYPESEYDFMFDDAREKYTGESEAEWGQILESLAKKYLDGDRIDWRGFDRPYSRKHVELPSYPFQRKRYWAPILDKNVKQSKFISPTSDQLIQILNGIKDGTVAVEKIFPYFKGDSNE